MQSNDIAQVSLDSVHGYQRGTCGYCHNPKGFVQVGFKIDCMPLQIYQDMINRGWSRYGNYYYKLDVSQSCCKMFSHRLDVTKYSIRKSHRKTLRKWNKFLSGQDFKRRDSIQERQNNMEVEGSALGKIIIPEELDDIQEELTEVYNQHEEQKFPNKDLLYKVLTQVLNQFENDQKDIKEALGIKQQEDLAMDYGFRSDIRVFKANSKKYGDYSTNFLLLLYAENKDTLLKAGVDSLPDFVAKVKRLLNEKLLLLLGSMNINVQSNGYIGFKIPENTLKKEQSEHKEKKRHSWCTVMTPMTRCQSSCEAFKQPEKNKNLLKALKLKKNNKLASERGSDQPEQVGKVTKGIFTEVIREQREGSEGRKFEIKMEKAKFERESFELYRRYCSRRHPGSNKDEKTYRQFMCLQALEYDQYEMDGHDLQFGCYHIKYYLDEKLIAVDVVDILPTSFYSVYFFYDPEYSHLSLGVISVLKEIEYMQRMQKIFPEFKYYQMGGYVQTSAKMSYKSDYEPAELLCPCTFKWVFLDEETKRKINDHQIKLANEDTKILPDLDFSDVDLDKFIKDNIKINANKAANLSDLGEIGQKYFFKVFKDITTGLGKRLINHFEFGLFN